MAGAAFAQAPAPQYPQQPAPQYPQQPAPQYPQQPPPGYPQAPPANPQQPQYPQQPPPGYPQQPGYPPGYPQQPPPGYPPPQVPGYPPPGYPQQPGYPQAGYPPGTYGQNPYAYAAAEPPGSHQHDGFYLKLLIGPGYAKFNGPGSATIKGAGVGFTLDIGGAISDNLIIFGEVTSTSLREPDVTTFTGGKGTATNTTVAANGFGAGLAYYIMPVNAYVSGALLIATNSRKFDNQDESDHTDAGVGFNLGGGKEFWVSTNWALGVGAQISASRVKEENDEWNTVAFSVGMTGTFN
jgi:hypothetical protein